MAPLTRRSFIELGGTAFVGATLPSSSDAEHPAPKLAPPAMVPLPLGQIRPAGWLQRQLRTQADGLSGHLDEFWPDVGPQSGWLGGSGESWERGPYFLDGLLPLAWLLNDDVLKAKAMRFVDWTLDHQQPNGMIGPPSNQDWWPRMVMAKALAQHHDATSDPRVLSVLTRYFHYQLASLPQLPLKDWGRYRWQDEVLVVEWLYERTADPSLLRLATLLQQQGYDWIAGFKDFRHTGVTTRDFLDDTSPTGNKPNGMETHGVNNGQAIKTAAVRYRLNGRLDAERENFTRQLDLLDRFHGMPNGMFSCDEHLAGLDPSHGTELCTVVETLFSLEVGLATFGDPWIADRLEKIAFNALPGTFTDDMWAHQYDQQANQVRVGRNSKPWTTNGPESNLYGLEPNFGCCTANFHQGWPKFTASLWMRSPDGGLVASLYAPCEVNTSLGSHQIHVAVETEYPFREEVRIVLSPDAAYAFPLHLRIPSWAHGTTLTINGEVTPFEINPGTFVTLSRLWRPGDVVLLHFRMQPTIVRGFHHSISLMRGPLVFSFDPGESWVKLRDHTLTADWQVYARTFWNYALHVQEDTAPDVQVILGSIAPRPFTSAAPPVRLRVEARRLDAWHSEDGVAAPVPEGLQKSSAPDVILDLIPYAAAKLRITSFPQLVRSRSSET